MDTTTHADIRAAHAAIVAHAAAATATYAADRDAQRTIRHMIGDTDAAAVSHAAMDPDAGDVIYWGDDPRRGVWAADYSVLIGVHPDMAHDVVAAVMETVPGR